MLTCLYPNGIIVGLFADYTLRSIDYNNEKIVTTVIHENVTNFISCCQGFFIQTEDSKILVQHNTKILGDLEDITDDITTVLQPHGIQLLLHIQCIDEYIIVIGRYTFAVVYQNNTRPHVVSFDSPITMYVSNGYRTLLKNGSEQLNLYCITNRNEIRQTVFDSNAFHTTTESQKNSTITDIILNDGEFIVLTSNSDIYVIGVSASRYYFRCLIDGTKWLDSGHARINRIKSGRNIVYATTDNNTFIRFFPVCMSQESLVEEEGLLVAVSESAWHHVIINGDSYYIFDEWSIDKSDDDYMTIEHYERYTHQIQWPDGHTPTITGIFTPFGYNWLITETGAVYFTLFVSKEKIAISIPYFDSNPLMIRLPNRQTKSARSV